MPELKSKRIAPVNKLAEKKEQEAASDFGACNSQLQSMQNQLRKLYQYRDDYNRQFTQATQAGMDSTRLQDYLKFINNINHSIDKVLEQVEKKKSECEQKKQVWLEKHQKVRIYTRVTEHFLKEEQTAANKAEQKQSDEASQAFAFRQKHNR